MRDLLRMNPFDYLFSASFGGVIGLCMGFSLLSLAELIYFFTIRLSVDLRKEKRAKKKKATMKGAA